MGGGASDSEEVGVDTGEGLEDLSDETLLVLKEQLGEQDFYRMYPQFKDII